MKRTICSLPWQWRQSRQAPPQYLRPPHPTPLGDRGVELGRQSSSAHRCRDNRGKRLQNSVLHLGAGLARTGGQRRLGRRPLIPSVAARFRRRRLGSRSRSRSWGPWRLLRSLLPIPPIRAPAVAFLLLPSALRPALSWAPVTHRLVASPAWSPAPVTYTARL